MITKNQRSLVKAAAVVAILLGLMAAVRFMPVGDWIQWFTNWVKSLGPAGMVIFVLGYVLGTMFFMPASVFILGAGIAFGFRQGLVLAVIGAALGAGVSFLVARYLARGFVEKQLARNEKLKAFDSAVAEAGWKIVLLFRLVPVLPFVISNYFFGLSKVRFWPYLLASVAGVFPATLLYCYLGYMGKVAFDRSQQPRTTQEQVLMGVGLVATIAVLVYVTRLGKRALQKIEAKHRKPPGSIGE